MRLCSEKACAVVIATVVLSLTACKQETQTATNEATNATRAAAKDAYVYGYPLVLMDVTRAKMTNLPSPTGTNAPMGQLVSVRAFPDATFTDVVSPNADTLYSMGWLDLEQEPIVMSVPDTHGRYYLMELLDGWTNVIPSPGKRTTGTGKGNFALTGPGWSGTLPGRGEGDQVAYSGGMGHRKDADKWQGRLCGRACNSGWVQADSAERVGKTVCTAEGRAGRSEGRYEDSACGTGGRDGCGDVLQQAGDADEGQSSGGGGWADGSEDGEHWCCAGTAV